MFLHDYTIKNNVSQLSIKSDKVENSKASALKNTYLLKFITSRAVYAFFCFQINNGYHKGYYICCQKNNQKPERNIFDSPIGKQMLCLKYYQTVYKVYIESDRCNLLSCKANRFGHQDKTHE